MNYFRDLGITTASKSFIGDHISMKRLLNREVDIHDFKFETSKYDGKRLDMQIYIGETPHVAWTSSKRLMEEIIKIEKEKFPIRTTIVELDNMQYKFS